MSAPSSDGRPSVDSQPSITSSPTLNSRYSGAYADHGEGSSSSRQSTGSRPNTGSVDGAGRRARDAIEEHDFARRKQRVRRSGGFLLDGAFPRETPSRRPHSHHARIEPAKDKRSSRLGGARNNEGQQEMHMEGSADSQPQNISLRIGKTRENASESMPPSMSIDPNQLVHMALNLSESRRRNISSSQLLASKSRVASGTQREGSSMTFGAGSSLRQYLNEPRRVSRNMSPMNTKSSPVRHMSSSMQRSTSAAFPTAQSLNASPATLARADKARAYIELRIEYLRLLDYLPPLKTDASAPGNFHITANNVPGSPQAQLTRMPSYAGVQHNLGRPYNPLQYIRNRRTRARERRGLDHSSEEFADLDQVRDWVDRIVQHSTRSSYRQEDQVSLPKIHAEHTIVQDDLSKLTRAHKGWVFSPEELLADAHWLEQGDNKTLIENRHGRKIFPPKEVPKQDFLQPRASKEYSDKRRRSWVEGLPGIAADQVTGDDSEKGSERGRKRRLLPALRTESPKGGKHSRRGSRLRIKDESDSLGSDTDSGKRKPRFALDTEHNIGPLARLLEQHAKEVAAKSPAIISPDTPDKWGRGEPNMPDGKGSRDSLDVPRPENGFAYVKDHGNFKMPPKVRTNPTLSIDDTEPRSSFEDLDSTAPNTPLQSKRFPYIGDDFSPPSSRAGSRTRKSKRSKLNIFHSHENSGDHDHDHRPDSAGTDKQRLSSEEAQEDTYIGAAILAAPGAVRNLLGHRKNDSVSSLPSPDKLRRKDTQEPHSAVTRFFKGVRQEGTKVGEFIFRRDRADDSDIENMSDRNSVDLDTDASAKKRPSLRPTMSRVATDATTASIVSAKNTRPHLELPTFRSVNQAHLDDHSDSDAEHHITRQTRDRKNSRSPRFNKLAPPRMDLGTLSGNSSTTSLEQTRSHSQERINKVLARPGGAEIGGLPPTALRKARTSDTADRRRSGSRPTLDGKRQWSIADDKEHVLQRKANANIITQADIARVRALFLCSGVKAKELSRRAYISRLTAPDFLTLAAATAKTQLFSVPRKEEHVLAARILVQDLEFSTKRLQTSLEGFRNKTMKELTSQIAQLQSRVDSDLLPRVLDGGDTAVRITSEVSGQGPLQVKQITDEIDRMLRARRRRMRWLRRFGWMMVEWALVGAMWWLWLIVVLLGSLKRVFLLGWGILRWLLWV